MMRQILLHFILPYAGWNFNFYCAYSGFSYRFFTAYFREDSDIRLPKAVCLCLALLGFAVFIQGKQANAFYFLLNIVSLFVIIFKLKPMHTPN